MAGLASIAARNILLSGPPPLPLSVPISWRYPEWWAVGLSGLAWIALGVVTAGDQHLHGLAGQLLSWSLMACAMMPPLATASLRVTAASSLWRRRDRAIAAFLVSFLGVWLSVGVAVSAAALAMGLESWPHRDLAAALAFLFAAGWQLSLAKVRALRGCHRTIPLAPYGWRADLACLRYGFVIGQSCLLSCWAMMLACVVAGHGLVALACCTVVAINERRSFRTNQRVHFALLAGLTLLYATAILGA